MSGDACPNCEAPAPAQYCPNCGQMQGELVPSIGSWLAESLDDLFSLESRVPRTILALWPPGRATSEWRSGRRATYLSPVRLYLLAAIPFFIVFFTARLDDGLSPLEMLTGDLILNQAQQPASLPPLQPLSAEAASDSAARAEWRTEFERRREFNRAVADGTNAQVGTGVGRIFDVLPVVVGVIMVPLLGLLLGIGATQPRRFLTRLVMALHLHVVAYAIAVGAAAVGTGLWVGVIGSGLYLMPARREVLGDSWARTLVVSPVIVFLYCLAFLFIYIGFVQLLVQLAPQWFSGGV